MKITKPYIYYSCHDLGVDPELNHQLSFTRTEQRALIRARDIALKALHEVENLYGGEIPNDDGSGYPEPNQGDLWDAAHGLCKLLGYSHEISIDSKKLIEVDLEGTYEKLKGLTT
jgi:hypothetical protein